MNKKTLTIGSAVLGIIFIIIAIIYVMIPAMSLPSFMPGHLAGSTHVHVKHAVASLILALALFAFAWFKSGETTSI